MFSSFLKHHRRLCGFIVSIQPNAARNLYDRAAFGFKSFEVRREQELGATTFEKRRNEFEKHLNASVEQTSVASSARPLHLTRFVKEDFLNSLTLLSRSESDLHAVMDVYKR